MKMRALFTLTAAFTLAVAAPGMAAGSKVKAQPGVYDPDATGIVVAEWQGGAGEPDGLFGDQGLVLQKNGPTETNAAAGAEIFGFEGDTVSELGFDYKTDGHCSGGSPRFNVQTTDGFYFVGGCGNATPQDLGNGWSRVRFDGVPGAVEYIEVIADEQGQSVLDNIDVNGTLIGKAGNL